MTVLSQVLFGELYIESYTLEDDTIDGMTATLDQCEQVPLRRPWRATKPVD